MAQLYIDGLCSWLSTAPLSGRFPKLLQLWSPPHKSPVNSEVLELPLLQKSQQGPTCLHQPTAPNREDGARQRPTVALAREDGGHLTPQCSSVALARAPWLFHTECTRLKPHIQKEGEVGWGSQPEKRWLLYTKNVVALLLPCSSREAEAWRNWGNSYAPQ